MEHTPLSDELIKKIFEEKIKPRLFNKITSVKNPKAVFLAGQPGAGKTNLGEETKKELNLNAVLIDVDKLRQYHPEIRNVKDQYTLDVDTRKFKALVLEECSKQKYNVIFDGTLGGNMKYIETEMQQMKDAGYTVKINALSVNDSISKLGFISRYESQVEAKGEGRNVDLSYHNEIYKNIPNNLTTAIGKGLVTEMTIYKRNHETKHTEHHKTYGADTFHKAKDIPILEFDKERSRPLTNGEKEALKEWYSNTISSATKNGSDISYIKNTISTEDPRASQDLKNQINSIKEINYKQIELNSQLYNGVKNNDKTLIHESIIKGADVGTLKKENFSHLDPVKEKAVKMVMQDALVKVAAQSESFKRNQTDTSIPKI